MAMDTGLLYKEVKPVKALDVFVDSYWMLHNVTSMPLDVVILPDGRIDLILTAAPGIPFHITLLGLGQQPSANTIAPGARICAISFQLPAVEYILRRSIAGLVDSAQYMPEGFWGFSKQHLDDFDLFCNHAASCIKGLLPDVIDERKRMLFELLYKSKGAMTVQELSDTVYWSSRQINRYFQQQFGVTLKAYCNMLRFRASFAQLKRGQLFPEEAFADQAHFIKEIRKFSGTIPKELYRNENGRFIQFSVLPPV